MITTEDIQKLAELSRINIAPEEQESLRLQIDSILGYIDQIKKASLVSGEVSKSTLAADDIRNVMREDSEPHMSSEFTEKILSAAPAREGNYLKVKKIL
ncbi:TPA: Asp-tRNA(Asn)/Glu-tRNA(Gln) amidotransferase subunit GatC [Candidatus Taylorbacteria bacterium]|nr:Asp-tRNA(Asn)/Glu-tRNA(Gln) amidotransferase subunit GatC [Candidatus Taylorbacteria bacterium]